ncbi:C-Jun-amino-terminal kinase-interacting protein 1a [Salvelinus sp. IW2-2015]|uniref:C-Jun-amino-terminal kinase-interacting protein 1a n=1 Tax=Salvelinus sp. IW2-2015 TaxID=2691554 RepID=UPI000CDF7545|nr:C-Jun-amino-terminal kinase-interacting protein 1-like [Salvelinus alpinus]
MLLYLSLAMESNEDGENWREEENGEKWMEDQWEKWLTHDISLEEFEDEDLSQVTEITDEAGASLNYDDLDSQDHVTWPASSEAGKADGRGFREVQAEVLHLDLIDAEEEIQEEEEHWGLIHGSLDDHRLNQEERGAVVLTPVRQKQPNVIEFKSAEHPVAMDTYRPKRPTTLALFPQVQPQPPRTQDKDTINNNSFGKKDTWKENLSNSNSSSPHITGDLTPTNEQVNDESKVQQHNDGSVAKQPQHRGTVPEKAVKAYSKDYSTFISHGPTESRGRQRGAKQRDKKASTAPHNQTTAAKPKAGSMRDKAVDGDGSRGRGGQGQGRGCCREEKRQPEATEEIYLTPVHQKNADTDRPDSDRPFLSQSSEGNRMSISSDAEGPPAYTNTALPNRTNPSISEEDEVYLQPPAPPPRSSSISSCFRPSDSEGGERERELWDRGSKSRSKGESGGSGALRTAHAQSSEADGLSYDSVKYTLVVDEHAKLELVSLKQCYQSYSDESDTETVYESANEEEDYEVDHSELKRERKSSRLSRASSSSEAGVGGGPRTRKFRNVFVNRHLHSSGAESFGLFSCVLDGVEQEQSHRAVFRFVPRHGDELELEVDDPLLMEVQADDLWCKAYNMRTGACGIFPAYYAAKVTQEPIKDDKEDWVDRFRVKFLGSVNVPYHKGNDVLCAAMQKIANNRRMTMQPPSACILEINMKGVKIIVQDECRTSERGDKCFHFFQLKNISFCGCHPKHNKYFGFITKHPDHQRFACHVFMSDDSMMPLAQSVGKAFQLYYKETVGYSCPTEDIFIE